MHLSLTLKDHLDAGWCAGHEFFMSLVPKEAGWSADVRTLRSSVWRAGSPSLTGLGLRIASGRSIE